ncbi:MAG TPA: AMP-binding protein [Euzebyales bacterium]|nr:AMP-binding protein [Euzebyales bacterium]
MSGWDPAEAPWAAAYPAGVPATYRYPAVPAGRLLDDAAQDFPDVVAVEYRRHRMTYRKLADHADRLAMALSTLGVGVGDRVAVALPNCPQLVIALFAAWRVGASVALRERSDPGELVAADPHVVVTLDQWYADGVASARPSLGDDATVIVTGRSDYLPFPSNVMASLRGRFPRITETERVLRFVDLIRRSHPAPAGTAVPAEEPVVTADGATATERALVVNCFQLRLWLPDIVAGDERVLLAVPLSSLIGVVWLLSTVLSAGRMILVDESRAAQRQRTAVRSGPTILPFDAAVAGDLLRSSWRRGTLGSVRIAVSTDGLDDEVGAQLEQLTDKGRIRRAWGIHGLVTHADPIYGRVRPASVGLPLPDTDAVVVDPDTGDRRPLGDVGRLWLRGPQLDFDAWVDAGCDATLDREGYLLLHDDPNRGSPSFPGP